MKLTRRLGIAATTVAIAGAMVISETPSAHAAPALPGNWQFLIHDTWQHGTAGFMSTRPDSVTYSVARVGGTRYVVLQKKNVRIRGIDDPWLSLEFMDYDGITKPRDVTITTDAVRFRLCRAKRRFLVFQGIHDCSPTVTYTKVRPTAPPRGGGGGGGKGMNQG